jgi:hypothetical protein
VFASGDDIRDYRKDSQDNNRDNRKNVDTTFAMAQKKSAGGMILPARATFHI